MNAVNPPVTAELLARYNISGPRYTSYPTADRFSSAYGEAQHIAALRRRQRQMGALAASCPNPGADPLSVYVHIPFCASLCYFCACNKIITRHREWAQEYLQTLQQEVALYRPYLSQRQPVSQLHLGGGSPTFLNDAELEGLMQILRQSFQLQADGEYSIEIDPRTVDAGRLRHLKYLGFNRISFGVQDFDARVQQAVHRIQPIGQVEALLQAARAEGFASINMDLIYGLPQQTAHSFAHTLEQVCRLRPDRIALYGYAHLPERFKAQRRIDGRALPSGGQKISMLAQALQAFGAAGYVYVGMDHFALPEDALAQAKRQGCLQRNFQGYSTQPDCDLLGLGVSAISRLAGAYSQNAKTLDVYKAQVESGHFPVERGLRLTRDDQIRSAVITAIMCQGQVRFEQFDADWQIVFADYFQPEMQRLLPLQEQGLVEMHAQGFSVTLLGWYFVRAVAMVFDHYLNRARSAATFSKIL